VLERREEGERHRLTRGEAGVGRGRRVPLRLRTMSEAIAAAARAP